jgi:hypothetical protein
MEQDLLGHEPGGQGALAGEIRGERDHVPAARQTQRIGAGEDREVSFTASISL